GFHPAPHPDAPQPHPTPECHPDDSPRESEGSAVALRVPYPRRLAGLPAVQNGRPEHAGRRYSVTSVLSHPPILLAAASPTPQTEDGEFCLGSSLPRTQSSCT